MQRNDVVVALLTLVEVVDVELRWIGSAARETQSFVNGLNLQQTGQEDEHSGAFDRQIPRVVPSGHTVLVIEAFDQLHGEIDRLSGETRLAELQIR